ncbi:MAG TPA: TIGR03435 family protein [Terriglobia bacterium]|jgi:uncharacterized protein (TIGR03435 family)
MEAVRILVFAFLVFTFPQSTRPSFDVAAIKRDTSAEGNASIAAQPGGRFVASRIALRRVIQFAYRDNQEFIGGPDWLDTDRWDIEAKAPDGTVLPRAGVLDIATPDTIALMVQSLLEDRFKLKAHKEMRDLPLYELRVAKGGSKVKASDDQTPPEALLGGGGGGGGRRGGGVPRGGIRMGRGDLEGQAMSMSIFATALGALYAGRPVVDQTGLKGLYDIRLQWTPDPGLNANIGPGGPVPAAPAGPSLFNALDEQLGLRLESAKGPLPVLVIDSIQRPSEN